MATHGWWHGPFRGKGASRRWLVNRWRQASHERPVKYGTIWSSSRRLQGSRLLPADERFHKETHSGSWGSNTDFARYLKDEGIKTLFFAGVNTVQCVFATMQDAAQQGYDAIMLRDACGTVSPPFAQKMVEFNAHKAFGFQSSCEDFVNGVEHIVHSGSNAEI